jgi:hypothetical protein
VSLCRRATITSFDARMLGNNVRIGLRWAAWSAVASPCLILFSDLISWQDCIALRNFYEIQTFPKPVHSFTKHGVRCKMGRDPISTIPSVWYF